MPDLRERAADIGFGVGWSAIRRLPEKAAYAMFRRMADRSWSRQGQGVQQLERNLRRVRPEASYDELRDLSRAGMRSYFRYWCDAFRLPTWSRERIVETFRVDGEEHLLAAQAQGRGVIYALSHSGNWDHAGAWLALTHGRLVTVAERLKPESLYKRFLDYRTSLGMEIIPLGSPDIMRELLRALKANSHVPLLADRDLSHTGVVVSLFGEPIKVPPGPALLSVMSGAPLLPATLHFEEHQAVARLHPPVVAPEGVSRAEQVALLAQASIDVIGRGIAEHPEDWHMMQPLWLADLHPHAGRAMP